MVSIIIPVYQVEDYLRQCIDSMLEQTYQDIQVILVDDGSPDQCGAICDEYSARDSRVLSLHKENGGVSSARNFGLQYVKGEYVTFCDSDDWYAPDWIATLVYASKCYGADIVIGNFTRVLEDGSAEPQPSQEIGVYDLTQPQSRTDYLLKTLVPSKHRWEVCAKLFSADLIRMNSIRFCETCGNYAEDLGFSLQSAAFAERIVSIESAGYCYRLRSGSMTQNSLHQLKLDSYCAMLAHCRPVIQRGIPGDAGNRVCDDMEFCLMGNRIVEFLWVSQLHPKEFRAQTIAETSDWPVVKAHIRSLLKKSRYLGRHLPGTVRMDYYNHLSFVIGMPWVFLRIYGKLTRMFHLVPEEE